VWQGSLAAALTYSNLVFGGAMLVWIFNSLAAVIRGTGNMNGAALVVLHRVGILLIPLSPAPHFWLGARSGARHPPAGAVALLAYYLLGSLAMAAYLWSPRSLLRPAFSPPAIPVGAVPGHSAAGRGRVPSSAAATNANHRGLPLRKWGIWNGGRFAGYGNRGAGLSTCSSPLVFRTRQSAGRHRRHLDRCRAGARRALGRDPG